MKLITIKESKHVVELSILKGRLESEGIPFETFVENMSKAGLSIYPFSVSPSLCVHSFFFIYMNCVKHFL